MAWHLGPLHPAEQALTVALAFGPFLVLAVVIAVRRRREDAAGAHPDQSAQQQPGQAPGRPGPEDEPEGPQRERER